MGQRWSNVKQKLECPQDKDAAYETNGWTNRDLIPIPSERRTYGLWSYVAFWAISSANFTSWSLGSYLLALGLSPGQAVGVIILGGCLSGALAFGIGWVGAKHHIGYAVTARVVWGMRGSWFPLIFRVFVACFCFGLDAFFGAQAVRVLIGALAPSFAALGHLGADAPGLQANDFIGLIIFMCIVILAGLIRPEKLQALFVTCASLFCLTCFGILTWSVQQAKGPGSFAVKAKPGAPAPDVGRGFVVGVGLVIATLGATILGQSNWTRYAKTRHSTTPAQLIVCPLLTTVTASLGMIATNAAFSVLGGENGQKIWQPVALLAKLQNHYASSPRARAGVFFASLGLVASQLSTALVLHATSCGMDMAALCPRYLNIRRGAYITAFLGILTQPWLLIPNASKFLNTLKGFVVLLAPSLGIMLADYYVVRRQKLKINELYIGSKTTIYWFGDGANTRPVMTLLFCVWPFLPGLVAFVNQWQEPKWQLWTSLFNLSLILGLPFGFAAYWLLNVVLPPPGLGEEAPFARERFAASVAPSKDARCEDAKMEAGVTIRAEPVSPTQ